VINNYNNVKQKPLKNTALSFYFILMCAYIILKAYRNSFDSANESQGGIWNILNALFVFIGFLYCTGLLKKKYKFPEPIRTGLVYGILVWIFALFTLPDFTVSSIFSLIVAPYFIFTVCAYFSIASKGITQANKRMFFICFYIIAAFSLYLMLLRSQENLDNQSDAYFLLCLLPFALMWKEGRKIILPICAVCVVVIMSSKRAGALAIIAALFIFFIVDFIIGKTNIETFKKIGWFLVIAILLYFVLSFVINRFDINIIERFKTLATDGGSSRDKIYKGVWEAFKAAPFWNKLTGYGISAITRIYGRHTSCHDDFLEILYDYGFVICIVFILFYIKSFLVCLEMIRYKFYGASAYAASLCISLVMSLFSNYAITMTHITGMAVFWGVVLAEWKIFLIENNIKNKKGVRKPI